jgi:D-amino-acid dehydrogenase
VVVGAGAIGLLAAYELARRGEQVIVYDKGRPGGACSAENAGWITPSFAGPLAAPGLVTDTLRSMVRPASPLYVRPRLDLDLARWLWGFWRHCNLRDYEAGCNALAALNRRTMACFDALVADGVEFEMHRTGLLIVFLGQARLVRHLNGLNWLLPLLGYAPPRELSRGEVLEMESGLSPAVVGGLFLEGVRHVRPETLAAGLGRRLAQVGVQVRQDVEVTGVVRRGREIRAIATRDGEVEVERLLLAAGAWSGVLARRIGFPLPMLPGKGYSITVSRPALRLHHALLLSEARVACTPFRDALRIAGTVEITSLTDGTTPGRIAAMRTAANRYLADWAAGTDQVEWMGLRSFLPDSLPAIGRAPGLDNVYVATAHGMNGITLAPVTGAAIADLMIRGHADVDLASFDPGRFVRSPAVSASAVQ